MRELPKLVVEPLKAEIDIERRGVGLDETPRGVPVIGRGRCDQLHGQAAIWNGGVNIWPRFAMTVDRTAWIGP